MIGRLTEKEELLATLDADESQLTIADGYTTLNQEDVRLFEVVY